MNHWNPTLFLKEGNSKGYNEEYLARLVAVGRSIQSFNVPVIFSLSHLANLSNTRYSDLHAFVSRNITHANYPYKSFPISKRTGGKRWISIPVPPLMAVQRWIAQNILNNIQPHKAAFAYVIDRRVKDHAEKHCAAEWVLKVDIKDFFSNISERQIYEVFQKLGYPKLLAFEMGRLCTRATPRRKGRKWNNQWSDREIVGYYCGAVGSLPQGAPTSPALSNLVCIEMDKQLEALSIEVGATYSRYADDLCFSFSNSTRVEVFEVKKRISKILWENGFQENSKKTSIIPPGARKIVTGLLVNGERPSVPREIRDKIRAHLYYSKKLGIPKHCMNRGFRSIIGFRNHLYGLIGYVHSINPQQSQRFLVQFSELPWINFDI
ncbi:MAG: reverse transcriptase family protein [Gallionella sp.]